MFSKKDSNTKEVKLTGTKKGNVYIVDWKSIVDKEVVCYLARSHAELSWLWPKMMNHVNFKTVEKLSKLNLVEGLPAGYVKKGNILTQNSKARKSYLQVDHWSYCVWIYWTSPNSKYKWKKVYIGNYWWLYKIHKGSITEQLNLRHFTNWESFIWTQTSPKSLVWHTLNFELRNYSKKVK